MHTLLGAVLALKVAVAPTDGFFSFPALPDHAVEKALIAGAKEACVPPSGGPARRRAACSRPLPGIGADSSLDACQTDTPDELIRPRVQCIPSDLAAEVLDLTALGCKTDACFDEAAAAAGATHILRLSGGFRDRHTLDRTLSATVLMRRLPDGSVRALRPEDVDAQFDSARFRPQHEALGIIRWLARSAVVAELVASRVPAVSPLPRATPVSILQAPSAAPSHAATPPSIVPPLVTLGVGSALLASGVVLWSSDGVRDCVSSGCATDRHSARLGIPLAVAGGLALTGAGAWLWSRLALSPHGVSLSGSF